MYKISLLTLSYFVFLALLICMFICFYLPYVLWRCWLGGRKGIRHVKTEWWGAGMVINAFMLLVGRQEGHPTCKNWVVGVQLPLTISCFNKIQIGFTFLVLAYPSSRRKRAIEQTCVLICFCLLVQLYFFLHSLVTIHLLSVMCCIVSQLCVFFVYQSRPMFLWTR